jgi:hypothetical protein
MEPWVYRVLTTTFIGSLLILPFIRLDLFVLESSLITILVGVGLCVVLLLTNAQLHTKLSVILIYSILLVKASSQQIGISCIY